MTVKAKEPLTERVAPRIKTQHSSGNRKGLRIATFLRLPEGLTMQDLNDEPGIWSNIQDSPNTSLRKFDRIRAVSCDEDWLINATVSHADRNKVILCDIDTRQMGRQNAAIAYGGRRNF